MKTNIVFSMEWHCLKRSESELFSAKYYFRKSDCFFEQLLLALNTLSEQGTALRFIKDEDFDDDEFKTLVPKIIDISINGNIDNIPIAREILIRHKDDKYVKKILSCAIDNYLNSYDDFIYRRIAELLLDLNYSEFKVQLMETCKESKNEDLREIYDDFIEKYK